jgi:hypothetical protein
MECYETQKKGDPVSGVTFQIRKLESVSKRLQKTPAE